ncbi:hypothetical protein [Micromonospora sp. NPDC023956]|uniref:hypothetical protein n=1 Tax=Micromonospora sp. NPDC023956 TaxID=3155722 RepID=UPI00340C6AC0
MDLRNDVRHGHRWRVTPPDVPLAASPLDPLPARLTVATPTAPAGTRRRPEVVALVAVVLLAGNEWTVPRARDWAQALPGGDGLLELPSLLAYLVADWLSWPWWLLPSADLGAGFWLVETGRVVLFVAVAAGLLRRVAETVPSGPVRAVGMLGAVTVSAVLGTVTAVAAHALFATSGADAVDVMNQVNRAIVGGFAIGVIVAWAGTRRRRPPTEDRSDAVDLRRWR